MGYPVTLKDKAEVKSKKGKPKTPDYINDPLPDLVTSAPVIKESFSWITPEWKALPSGPKTVKVKGVALTSDIISKNKRKYLDEELKMAARTLAGKKVTINHKDEVVVGNVIHAEYENGAIEYLAQIKKEPYVSMLKNHDANVKGVSVQAGYIHNTCVKCGQKFFSEKAWRLHMEEAHGIKDGIEEVHGIMFDALSLVVGDATPGVPTTTVELMETDRNSTVMRLFETALTERGFATQEGCVWSAKGFSSGEACVAAMRGKVDDPEAYCYSKAETAETEEPDKTEESKTSVKEPDYSNIDEPVRSALKELWNLATQQKRDFEKILVFADKNIIAKDEQITTLEERLLLLDTEKGLRETLIGGRTFINTVKETLESKDTQISELTARITEIEKYDEKLHALETRLDNLEAKQKGNFRGGTKPEIAETQQTGDIGTPKLPYDATKKSR